MVRKTNFPQSRELFRLARMVADGLDISTRLSDVDIGRFVGFESARTSRWKHGQISVADAPRLLSLSHNLDIDISLLNNVAAGYLTAEEARRIMSDKGDFARFLGSQIMLPEDEQRLTLVADDGARFHIVRRAAGEYQRSSRQRSNLGEDDHTEDSRALLVDSSEDTINLFNNLTGPGTGITGLVARSGPEALIMAGKHSPHLVVFDVFIGQTDGFAAIKSLAESDETREADIFATSFSVTPDIVRAALGSGARDLVQRPLLPQVLGILLNRLRRHV